MSRVDRFEFTLDEETEKRLYELLTDMDTRNTNRFWIKDKRGYHAEYVKVRRGEWLLRTYMPHRNYCSHCNNDSPYDKRWKYCPNCGAKMESENETD